MSKMNEMSPKTWPSQASHYGEAQLRAIQGERDICEECCQPFRRLTYKTICSACYSRRLIDAAAASRK